MINIKKNHKKNFTKYRSENRPHRINWVDITIATNKNGNFY